MTPTKQKKIDSIAYHLYFEVGTSPESTDSDHIKAAMDALHFNGYDKSEFINVFQNIEAKMFNAVIDAMWKIDAKADA